MVAVASRTQEKADAFGETWGIPHRYASQQALIEDPAADVVYIATPHAYHYQNMLMCLEAGKHVLCEKPFTLNAGQAAECITLARRKNLFLKEAFIVGTKGVSGSNLGQPSKISTRLTYLGDQPTHSPRNLFSSVA